jgi:hypothetical protein
LLPSIFISSRVRPSRTMVQAIHAFGVAWLSIEKFV